MAIKIGDIVDLAPDSDWRKYGATCGTVERLQNENDPYFATAWIKLDIQRPRAVPIRLRRLTARA